MHAHMYVDQIFLICVKWTCSYIASNEIVRLLPRMKLRFYCVNWHCASVVFQGYEAWYNLGQIDMNERKAEAQKENWSPRPCLGSLNTTYVEFAKLCMFLKSKLLTPNFNPHSNWCCQVLFDRRIHRYICSLHEASICASFVIYLFQSNHLHIFNCIEVNPSIAAFTATDQGCQIFLGPKYQNGGKIYQITTKYTKLP
jgi:hypothetical protein